MTDQDILMQGPGGANVASETLDLMRLHGVPPTSANYEVWLSYRLGRNQPLREAIDSRIGSGTASRDGTVAASFAIGFSQTVGRLPWLGR